jgi:hypothetical protein
MRALNIFAKIKIKIQFEHINIAAKVLVALALICCARTKGPDLKRGRVIYVEMLCQNYSCFMYIM